MDGGIRSRDGRRWAPRSGPAGRSRRREPQGSEGTPIPTTIVPLAALMLAFYRGTLFPVELFGVTWHAIALLFLVSGLLMISKTLRIPKR